MQSDLVENEGRCEEETIDTSKHFVVRINLHDRSSQETTIAARSCCESDNRQQNYSKEVLSAANVQGLVQHAKASGYGLKHTSHTALRLIGTPLKISSIENMIETGEESSEDEDHG